LPDVTGGRATGGVDGGGAPAAGNAAAGGDGACGVPAASDPPYPVTFRFTNPGTTTVWLSPSCLPEHAVTIRTCADGYQVGLSIDADCMECSGNPCPRLYGCGSCSWGSYLPVPAGTHHDVTWAGFHYFYEHPDAGCWCNRQHTAPAGLYRVSIAVWKTDPFVGPEMWFRDLVAHDYTVGREFTLDRAGAVVEVDLLP
jgi:hypothetical protein